MAGFSNFDPFFMNSNQRDQHPSIAHSILEKDISSFPLHSHRGRAVASWWVVGRVKNGGFWKNSRFWQLRSSIRPTCLSPILFVSVLSDAFSESLNSILKLGDIISLNKVIVEKRKKMHFFGVFPGYFGNSQEGGIAVKSCFLDYFCRFMWFIWSRSGYTQLRSPLFLDYRKGL